MVADCYKRDVEPEVYVMVGFPLSCDVEGYSRPSAIMAPLDRRFITSDKAGGRGLRGCVNATVLGRIFASKLMKEHPEWELVGSGCSGLCIDLCIDLWTGDQGKCAVLRCQNSDAHYVLYYGSAFAYIFTNNFHGLQAKLFRLAQAKKVHDVGFSFVDEGSDE